MRAETFPQRARLLVRAAAFRVLAQHGALKAAVIVSYIRARVAIGDFFKRRFVVEVVKVSENELYFAEDYVDPTYASTPMYITFGKQVGDTVTASDSVVLVLS